MKMHFRLSIFAILTFFVLDLHAQCVGFTISNIRPNAVSCGGANDGDISIVVSGGTIPYNYLWSNGATTQNISSLTAGLYSVTVTDNIGCTTTASSNITEPIAVSSSILQINNYNGAFVSCPNSFDGSIQAVAGGGAPPYSYQWNSGQTTDQLSNIGRGNYIVTITDASGCFSVDSLEVVDPIALQGNEVHVDAICNNACNAQIIVNATPGTGTLGVNGYEYRIFGPGQLGNIFSNNNSFFNLCAGTYTVEIRDGNNCILPISVALSEPPALQISTNQNNASCFSIANGNATANASGGISPYTYSWSNGSNTQTVTGLAAGNYSVTATDDNGCEIIDNITISSPSAISVTMSGTQPSCFGSTDGSAIANPTGGTAPYNYAWSTGSGGFINLGLPAGTFFVTVTDNAGCSISNSITISQPSAVSVSISGTNLSCSNDNSGTAQVTASGGTQPYRYLWNTSDTTASVSDLNAGIYFVIINDINGCQQSASITLTQPSVLTTTALTLANVSCFGLSNGSASANPIGGTPPYQFAWPNGQNTAITTGLSAGVQNVTITDANSCSITAQVLISEPPLLEILQTSSTPVSCTGGSDGTASVFINGGVSPYIFNWTAPGTGQTINNLSQGSYSVSVTDVNGCSATASVVVVQPVSAINGYISVTNALCNGSSDGQLVAVVTGGTLSTGIDYGYVWSNNRSGRIVSGVPAGNYTVTVTDENACTFSMSTIITEPSPIIINLSGQNNVTCPGGFNGNATLSAFGGTGTLSYQWPNGQLTQTVTGLNAGSHTASVTDQNGCIQTFTITISEGNSITITSQQTNVSCYGENDGIILVTSSGLSLYNWSNGRVGNPVNNLTVGQYILTATDSRGCTVTETFNITQPDSLIAGIQQVEPVFCNGGENARLAAVAVGGTPNYVYRWSNGNNTRLNYDIPAGTYTVTIIDNNGCRASRTFTLSDPPLLSINANSRGVRCAGEQNGQITASATGGTTFIAGYQYSLDSIQWQSGNIFNSLPGGAYTVFVRDNYGCIDTIQTFVSPADTFSILSFVADTLIEYGDTVELFATINQLQDVEFNWFNITDFEIADSLNLSITVSHFEQHIYRFTAINPLGCVIDSTVTINVKKPRRAGAPQAFSPNQDGNNDWFYVQSTDRVKKVSSLRIFDRWGNMIFDGKDMTPNEPQEGWDGNFKGDKMASGIYSWYAELLFDDDRIEVLRGDLTLFR